MLVRAAATIVRIVTERAGVQEVETEHGMAIGYVDLVGRLTCGDAVLVNRTAQVLGLGTGGYDFVIARLGDAAQCADPAIDGHIIKLRYTPAQHAVRTLEEDELHAAVWERDLAGFPVVVGQLHSQIAPAAAAIVSRGLRCAYIMTDGAALPIALSKLVSTLTASRLVAHTITAGQAFGGEFETVTVHSALLAAKHILGCDAAIVCQGPGNAGTATKYGFSGIEQAALLDAAAALGGTPIAIARVSSGDLRRRHQGLSHHTVTAMTLARSRCLIAMPDGIDADDIGEKHDVRPAGDVSAALELLKARNIDVTTMGRSIAEDAAFFEAAAAAGYLAADIASPSQ